MPTFDFTQGGVTGVVDSAHRKMVVFEREIDFADTDYAGVVGSDIVQLLNIPAGFHMQTCLINVLTAAGGVVTCTVGDGANPDGWILLADLNAVAATHSSLDLTEAAPPTYDDAYMGLGGKYYAAADTIDIVVSDVLLIAKVKIFALGYMAN